MAFRSSEMLFAFLWSIYVCGYLTTQMDNFSQMSSSASVIARTIGPRFFPKLSQENHKGCCGRIGVVGGSKEYTGAPYFSAIASLRAGCDLSHVFTPTSAASVIKSYSPELIVHPLLDEETPVESVLEWVGRLNSLVVGPGLGRSPYLSDRLGKICSKAREMSIPIIVDADGLYFVNENPSLVSNYNKAILTPNFVELGRLYHSVLHKDPKPVYEVSDVTLLAKTLGVCILYKGFPDIISDGITTTSCDHPGSVRRCGGQGDLLTGSLATFAYWADKRADVLSQTELGPRLSAAFAACFLIKECSRRAFALNGRAMITSDLMQFFPKVLSECFDSPV